MTSVDANILLYSFSQASPYHAKALEFLERLTPLTEVAISELVLVELYTLLRNPTVVTKPLEPSEAVDVIQRYRSHPRWMVLGFDPDTLGLHDELWELARAEHFGRRRIYDVRLALSLRRQGVSKFATANVKHFDGMGFLQVWNPLD